jgi:uncharacterized protein (TIGR03437 family)
VDGKDNLFINDFGHSLVREVTPDGIIHTIAGNGTGGNSGDGGPATSASIVAESIAVDGKGNLYIATGGSVRQVSTDGTITTFAGGGNCERVCDGQPATNVMIQAVAVAVDGAGNLLISDDSADDLGCYFYLRKVSPTGILTTLAGVPGPCNEPSGDGGPAATAALGFSAGIAVDAAGNIFLTQTMNQTVRRISPDGVIATIAGGLYGYSGDGGPAIGAALGYPMSLAADSSGNLYFSDTYDSVVRELHPVSLPFVSAIVDAAGQSTGPVTPGKIVTIYGAGIGPSSLVRNLPSGGSFSVTAGGVSVTFNSVRAPVLYASATQIAVVAPYELSGPSAEVQVIYNGNISNQVTVPVTTTAPSLFTANQTGVGQAAAINVSTGTLNSAVNPVKIGEYVTLFATGEGQTNPGGVDGQIVSSSSIHPVLPVNVTVGGVPATVQYTGESPGQVAGTMQINVQIPAGVTPGGYVPVTVQVGAASTGDAVWIAVSGN